MAAKKKAPAKKRDKALNPMQQRFCQEYVVDFNATQAAIRAGYSAKTAGAQAYKLLKIAQIQDYITQVSDNLREKTEIDAIWVRKRLAMLATADMRSLLDDDGNILPPSQWPDDIAAAISGMDVLEVNGDLPAVVKKVRKVDQLKALELLGKHKDIAAFKEVVEHNAGEGMIEAILAGRKRARGGE
ncbi:terminase small subunit [Alcanivorax jadensis]|uniref:terminase small subunit n=1 Tax=Alcanivorax jadensis TaxID=64988 RepID=UPI002355BC29|nr:terminase small subunit [Alcanivorax jadensis]|tara:strand:+ start:1426 stop:1983 length:558 start_codon:yes stop_codon:yes gene_type:complete